MTTSVNLFSYGTLQLEPVQMATFGRLLEGQADAMTGWFMDQLEITDPEVLKTSGERFHPVAKQTGKAQDEIAGKVFRITPEELAHADAYEVSDYKRVEVTLKSGDRAWVYVKA
ncbi:MAG: gamma-glutamylcyclotransferase family protein [Asticcacaulis sp.]